MLGAGLADQFVLVAGADVVVVDADASGLSVAVNANLDPTRRCGVVHADGVKVPADRVLRGAAALAHDVARVLVSAEAAGGAQECVERATAYAKERQQFGRVIAMFQAVKHHCANMLVASELATAAVWDAARSSKTADEQFSLASAVAAVQSIPAFVRNAQLNIQVHGGIGFTWEHDGHMLLRRAGALAALFDANAAARDVTALRVAGTTRALGLDLPPEAEELRVTTRAVAEEIAALPADDQRTRLIETGYIQPHWPKPWGRAAKALEQLVIDEEFARAGVQRPQFGITGWVILTLIQHSTQDQIERWVRPTLNGELVWCQLFSEPDAGSDAAGVRTRATRTDGGFIVSGQKVWTSGAQNCHRGLATVRTNFDVAKHDGITTVVIDMHAARCRSAAPARGVGRVDVQRGVLQRRLRPGRRCRRSGRRRVGSRALDARQRARQHRRGCRCRVRARRRRHLQGTRSRRRRRRNRGRPARRGGADAARREPPRRRARGGGGRGGTRGQRDQADQRGAHAARCRSRAWSSSAPPSRSSTASASRSHRSTSSVAP